MPLVVVRNSTKH